MYAKVFSKIMDSSIAADWYLRHVFMDLLVLSDRDGVVDMTVDAIRRRTNAPDETMLREALRRLERPDDQSRTEDDDGRRIELIDDHRDWGWRIINYAKYRTLKTSDELRAATAERVRRHRAKKRSVTQPVTQVEASKDVNVSPLPTLPPSETPERPETLGSPSTGALSLESGLKRMPKVAAGKAETELRKRIRKAELAAAEKEKHEPKTPD